MGKLTSGAFGHVTGRVGNLVSYTLNGKNIVRQIGQNTKPPSSKKLANYQRMAVVNQFLKTMVPFLKLGFSEAVAGTDKNAYNEAVSYNKRYALQGEYPEISMNYQEALITKGNLPPALSPAIQVSTNGVEFTWQMPTDIAWRYRDNRAMMLLYFPEGTDDTGIPDAIYELSGAKRKDLADFIALTEQELAKPFHAYIAFIAEDRYQVSDSAYVGA